MKFFELINLSQRAEIVFARQFKKLTQDEVSEKLDLSGESKRITMTGYEKGERSQKKIDLLKLLIF